ncbi:hypothetical protein [Spirosoma profusum]|uniref:hypothetical protein n=1 Tax=Spirosoma profusum TaxID=2771354 RepID=UPI001CC245A2|nr:hypothetical protein [Spirosoma profusum]
MNDKLTFDDLQAYRAGQLSGPARYRVERLLLENPFYADALAGLEAMQQTAADTLPNQLADLRTTLHQRIHESANKKRLWPLWIATTTAAILFMLAMAIYFIYFAPKRPNKSQPIQRPKTTLVTPFTDSHRAFIYERIDGVRALKNAVCLRIS